MTFDDQDDLPPTADVEQPDVVADTEPRCDCPALSVPHIHEQGGPVALVANLVDVCAQDDHDH